MPVSVDTTDKNRMLKEKLSLSFDLYNDTGGALATEWGVFDSENGFNLAATFVVAKGGQLVYRYLGTSRKDRPTAEALLTIAAQAP